MEETKNLHTNSGMQKHDKNIILLAFAHLFERISFFGIKVYVFHFIYKSVTISEVGSYYSSFTITFLISSIIGAFIGDLLIGSKKVIYIGGLLNIIGCSLIGLGTLNSILFGMLLVGIGSGFYKTNILALFGKLYLHKTKILDSGYMVLIFAINAGAFIGTISISILLDKFTDLTVALLCTFNLLSFILIHFIKVSNYNSFTIKKHSPKNTSIYLLAIITVAIFWSIFNYASINILADNYSFINENYLRFLGANYFEISQTLSLPIIIFFAFYWTKNYSSSANKLSKAFIIGAIAIILNVFLILSGFMNENHTIFILSVAFILSLSKVFISPILISTTIKNINPKYFAIAISLMTLPQMLFNIVLTNTNLYYNDNSDLSDSIILVALFSIMAFIVYFYTKRNNTV